MGSLSLLQGNLPDPGIELRSPALQAIVYQLSHKGSPRILEWVAYLTKELNQGLLHCKHIIYQQSYQGSPRKKENKISSMFRLKKINFDHPNQNC